MLYPLSYEGVDVRSDLGRTQASKRYQPHSGGAGTATSRIDDEAVEE